MVNNMNHIRRKLAKIRAKENGYFKRDNLAFREGIKRTISNPSYNNYSGFILVRWECIDCDGLGSWGTTKLPANVMSVIRFINDLRDAHDDGPTYIDVVSARDEFLEL